MIDPERATILYLNHAHARLHVHRITVLGSHTAIGPAHSVDRIGVGIGRNK